MWLKKKGHKGASNGFSKLKDHYFLEHPEHLEQIAEYAEAEEEEMAVIKQRLSKD